MVQKVFLSPTDNFKPVFTQKRQNHQDYRYSPSQSCLRKYYSFVIVTCQARPQGLSLGTRLAKYMFDMLFNHLHSPLLQGHSIRLLQKKAL